MTASDASTSIPLPALALAAVAGRRKRTLELAKEIEDRGYAGIYCASFGDGMGLCHSLAHVTERIPFGTAIANLYTRHATDYAASAAAMHELSDGRFRFGIGVSHAPMNDRLGVSTGKPLSDVRDFVGMRSRGPADDTVPSQNLRSSRCGCPRSRDLRSRGG